MECYEKWIDRARSNYVLGTVSVIPSIYYDDLCFELQQSAEKALKGLLIYYGVEPAFTHNITILLDELKKLTEIPENVDKARKLTDYAVQTRYPGSYDDITKEVYNEAVEITKTCLDWVESKIAESEKNKKP
jgi:HEPN domain-containing protein